MADRPIIFSAPMVRALLEGRKTMTRRLATSPLRKVQAGDRLWVRENFSGDYYWNFTPPAQWGPSKFWYWADGSPEDGDWTKPRPSIHMPRWASRITLIITDTKRERLQDISDIDALAEGIQETTFWRDEHPPGICFSVLWDALHGDATAWSANPDVVALSFRVIQANIDAPEALAA